MRFIAALASYKTLLLTSFLFDVDSKAELLNSKSFLSNLSFKHTSRMLKTKNMFCLNKNRFTVKQNIIQSVATGTKYMSLVLFQMKSKLLNFTPYYFVTFPYKTFGYRFYIFIGKHCFQRSIISTKKMVSVSFFPGVFFFCYLVSMTIAFTI